MSASEGFASIYREALPVLLISLVGSLFSGLVLEIVISQADTFPGLLVAVPVFLATRGNVYGALGGRIASGLHQGLIEPRFQRDERLLNAVLASFTIAISMSIVIATLSWAALALLGWESASLPEFVAILLVAGVLTSVVLILGLLVVIFAGYKRGYDPDNLVGPIVTTLGDVFGMSFLLLATILVEAIG
ncbi:Permease, similar to cation transporter [Halapricum desulfuricans]|uniref:Permease, similar to cation transporter n=1 Tax=Halapricum desulfuricans TaxID=2841257 RepID=A0A897NDW3_9EURY|nr:magnesium transporter [Halapricum desulfuricans]QSG10718.1 Permease, similar to cation transporter [Halapricum desulfuricans]